MDNIEIPSNFIVISGSKRIPTIFFCRLQYEFYGFLLFCIDSQQAAVMQCRYPIIQCFAQGAGMGGIAIRRHIKIGRKTSFPYSVSIESSKAAFSSFDIVVNG